MIAPCGAFRLGTIAFRMAPHVLVHFVWLGLLLVQLVFSSWLGTRLGAFAVMRILVPLGFLGYWVEWILKREAFGQGLTAAQLQVETAASLLSFLTVFSFALPYFALLTLLARRPSNGFGVVAIALGAVASAVALRFLYSPGTRLIAELPPFSQHATAAVIAFALMLGSHRLLRASADRGAAARCPPWNALLRLLTLAVILLILDDPALRETPVAFVLSSVPRLTLELIAGTHAANGPKSAAAVIAGLPLGLAPYFTFCIAFPYLSHLTPIWIGFAGASAMSLCSIVPLLVEVLKRRESIAGAAVPAVRSADVLN